MDSQAFSGVLRVNQSSTGQPLPYAIVPHRRRARIEAAFKGLCISISAFSVLLLFVLLAAIAYEGLPRLTPQFFMNSPESDPEKCGIWIPLVGSTLVCFVCALLTLPLGVGAAVFLEVYKPRIRWLRSLHSGLGILISNLAGVPSIVYGLLGLSAFVHVFGWFGTIDEPRVEVGADYYFQFESLQEDRFVLVPVSGSDAPSPELVDGMQAYTTSLKPFDLRVIEPGDSRPSEAAELRRSVESGESGSIIPKGKWYHFRLPFGETVIAGALTLMLVVLPMVIISSQEAIRAVPPSLREGALGLGCTQWQVVWNTTLPSALPGIMTGAILAMSRAIGEAAPIIMVSGALKISETPSGLMSPYTVMPLQIYYWADQPNPAFFELAATGILVLLSVLFVFNLAAVIVRQYAQRQLQ